MLSNTAGVGADLAGLGKVIDYEATGTNADDSKAGISTTVHHRKQPKVNKHAPTGSTDTSSEHHHHVIARR